MSVEDGVSVSGLDILYRDPSWDNLGSGPNTGRPRLIPVLRAKDNNQSRLAPMNGHDKAAPGLESTSKRDLLARKSSNIPMRASDQSNETAADQDRSRGFQSLRAERRLTVKGRASTARIATSSVGSVTKNWPEPPNKGGLATDRKSLVPKARKSVVKFKTDYANLMPIAEPVARGGVTESKSAHKSRLPTCDTSTIQARPIATNNRRLSTSTHRHGPSSTASRNLSTGTRKTTANVNIKSYTLIEGGSAVGKKEQERNKGITGNCKRFPENDSTVIRRQNRLASDKRRIVISHGKEERSTSLRPGSRHARQSVIELQEQKKLVSCSKFLLNDSSSNSLESRLKQWNFGTTANCKTTPQHQRSGSLSRECTLELDQLQHQAGIISYRLPPEQSLKEENEQKLSPQTVAKQSENLAETPLASSTKNATQKTEDNLSEAANLRNQCDDQSGHKAKHAQNMDPYPQVLRQGGELQNGANANPGANLCQQLGKILETSQIIVPNGEPNLKRGNTISPAAIDSHTGCSHQSVIDMLTNQLPLFVSAVDQLRSMIVDCSLNDLEASPDAKYTPVLAFVNAQKIRGLTSEEFACSSLRPRPYDGKQTRREGGIVDSVDRLPFPGDSENSDDAQSTATSHIASEVGGYPPQTTNHNQGRELPTSGLPDTLHGHGQLHKSESIEDALRFILTNSNAHNGRYNTRTSSLAGRKEYSSQLHAPRKLPTPQIPPGSLKERPLLQESRNAASGLQARPLKGCPEQVEQLQLAAQRAQCNLLTDDCLSMASTDAPPQYSMYNPKGERLHPRSRSNSIVSELVQAPLHLPITSGSWVDNSGVHGQQSRLQLQASSKIEHGHTNQQSRSAPTSVRQRLASKIRIQGTRQRPKATGKALS